MNFMDISQMKGISRHLKGFSRFDFQLLFLCVSLYVESGGTTNLSSESPSDQTWIIEIH